MSEIEPRPRIDLFPSKNRVSNQELIEYPERAEHYELLITDKGIHLEHGEGLGCTISFGDNSVNIRGKLVYAGMEIRSCLPRGSFLSLTDINDPRIGPARKSRNQSLPTNFPGRYTLVIRND